MHGHFTSTFLSPPPLRPLFRFAVKRFGNMAWTCSATSNEGLVDNLVSGNIVKIPRVETVLRHVDRRAFLPPNTTPYQAYADAPLALPCAATISAPHMHALALELLNEYLTPSSSALDVGAGSGFFAACMASLVGPDGTVVAIEHAPQLSQLARTNLDNFANAHSSQSACPVIVHTSDGRLGASQFAPFKAIHVGAAAPGVPPALVSQLARQGAMVIPIGPSAGSQRLVLVKKAEDGNVSQRTVCHVRYVPLCDLRQQLGGNE